MKGLNFAGLMIVMEKLVVHIDNNNNNNTLSQLRERKFASMP